MAYTEQEEDERYSRYVVTGEKAENARGMEERECPLCHERVSDFPSRKPTVFLSHLSLDKDEHHPLNAMCNCGHTRISHLDSRDRGIGFGVCSFSKTCGCKGFKDR
jgi:hypothetical protein